MKLAFFAAVIAVLYQGEPRDQFAKAEPPGVRYRMNLAMATSAPWLNSNIWKYRRAPDKRYLLTFKEKPRVALAMAEAHSAGAQLSIELPDGEKQAYEEMRAFLAALPEGPKEPWVNFAVTDDGSPMAGEVMNLAARRNLLFRVSAQPKRGEVKYALNKSIRKPYDFVQQMRQKLGDDKRVLRIYGSELVITSLAREGNQVRLFVVQYGERPVEFLRVRIKGHYPLASIKPHVFGAPDAKITDYVIDGDSTEFFIDRIPVYAVVDLTAKS